MYDSIPSPSEFKTIKGVQYEYYNQFYEKEDCVTAAKELRTEGHKAYTSKSQRCDNCYILYVHFNEEENPFV